MLCCGYNHLHRSLRSLRIYLESFQVGPFAGHYLSQQLFLQTNRGHCEVDEGGLGLELRWEMGVGQLGMDNESKVAVVFTLLSSNLNVTGKQELR